MKKLLPILILCLTTTIYAADTKLSALAESTTVADADLIYIVDGGVSSRMTVLNLFDTIDTFAELNTIVVGKTLVNEEDVATFDSIITFSDAITLSDGGLIDQFANNYIDFSENADKILFHFDGTNLNFYYSDGALNFRNQENGIDGIVNVGGYNAGEKGIFRVLSDGDDKYIELYNDDTDAVLTNSAGNIIINPVGLGIVIGDNGNEDYTITFDGDTSNGILNYDEDNADFEFDQDVITTGVFYAPAFDAPGAEDIDYGSADITDHSFTTDDSTFIIDGGITVSTGDNITLGAVQWNSADEIDGTKIKDADYGDVDVSAGGAWTLDTDSVADNEIDYTNVTGADLTLTDAGAITSTGTITATVGFDIVGAVDMDYGSIDVTDHTFVTDGTGTAEIVLPAGSIDSTEILDATVTEVDLNVTNAPGAGEDNYVLTYNHAATNMTWAVDATGTTAWDDIANPDNGAATTITFDNAETTIFTGDNDAAASFFTIQNSDADHTVGNLYLLDLDYSADVGDVDADFFKCQDQGGVVFNIQQGGDTTTTGNLEAATITEGGQAVPNATDHLGFFGGTTSAQLDAEISDDTGGGVLVFNASPTFDYKILLDYSHDTPAIPPTIVFQRDRDGDPTADVSSGDYLASEYYYGYHTDGYDLGAEIRTIIDNTPGNTDMPARFEFLTSADGSATPTLRMTIDSAGEIELGADDNRADLKIHHAGILTMYDASDDTSVVIGPVGDGTTVLGVTGTIDATNLQIGSADVGITTGDVWTGNHDFGGADLEIPQAAPAVPDVDGEIEVDFTDGKVVIQHSSGHAELGASTDVVVGTLIKSWSGTIFEPDGVNDVITVKAVNSIEFPHGVVITAVYLGVSENSNYVLTVQNFDDFDTINAGNGTIDTVTYTADTTGEVIDTTPTFATIAAGQIIMISIPATDVDWIHFEIYYYEPAAG